MSNYGALPVRGHKDKLKKIKQLQQENKKLKIISADDKVIVYSYESKKPMII